MPHVAPGTADSQELPSESSDGPMRAMQREIRELAEALHQIRNQSIPPPPPTGSLPRSPALNIPAIQDAEQSYQTELQLAQERGDPMRHQGYSTIAVPGQGRRYIHEQATIKVSKFPSVVSLKQ